MVGRETFERDDKTKHTRDQSNYLNIENDWTIFFIQWKIIRAQLNEKATYLKSLKMSFNCARTTNEERTLQTQIDVLFSFSPIHVQYHQKFGHTRIASAQLFKRF